MPSPKGRKMKPIFCVAGRSGGHIIPCLNYALAQQKQNQDIVFLSTNTPLDKSILKDKPITKHIPLTLENIPYKKLFRWPFFIWQLFASTLVSFYHLIKQRPTVIISTGGYISIPVCIIGRLLGIKVELFELNFVPGKATTFLAPFATNVYTCFPETLKLLKRKNCHLGTYPLKPALLKQLLTQQEALSALNLDPNKKTLLLLGGSQGSQTLNKILLNILHNNDLQNWQVIHQVGNADPKAFKEAYKKAGITAYVFQFHHQLETIYPAADKVICRAGAGTLFELLHLKKQCIVIPLEASTTNHQLDNAQSFANRYPTQFTLLHQTDLESNPNTLYELLDEELPETARDGK